MACASPSRGVKTQATVRLDDLIDGSPKAEAILPEIKDGVPEYPTVVAQARENMRKHENCVLLTRVGSFYEVCLHVGQLKAVANYTSAALF